MTSGRVLLGLSPAITQSVIVSSPAELTTVADYGACSGDGSAPPPPRCAGTARVCCGSRCH